MKSRAPRGSTLLTALGVTFILALIVSGVLAYTGGEQGRSGGAVRDIDAQTCAESAAQWGRKFYGDRYQQWNSLLRRNSGYTNPEETDMNKWGVGSYGRLDGKDALPGGLPADFRVTIRDNVDELPITGNLASFTPAPEEDNDLQIILRAECLIPRLAMSSTKMPKTPRPVADDPFLWNGKGVLTETSQTRNTKVIEVTLIHVPTNEYREQRGGGGSGDQVITQ